MAKNIVVFSDGTSQDGAVRLDARLSNIYKLYRASRIGPDSSIDPAGQIAFYDPGLGTDSDSHGFGRVGKTIYKLAASVAGRGIATNIADCYEFIVNHWQPGDRIFIFGFSRGAYTARCVAQLLSLCGVPTHASNDPSAEFKRFGRGARQVAERAVHQVYEHGAGYPRGDYEAERDELARRFRVEFGSDVNGIPNAGPHFIGVFDTVAALGAAGWKRWGIILGLTLGAAALVAAISGIALTVPAQLFIDLFLIAAVSAILWAAGSTLGAVIAGSLLAIVAVVAGIRGIAFPVPHLSFGRIFAAVASVATLVTLIKLRSDSYRCIDNFPPGSKGRKGHHIRWKAANYDRGLSAHVGYARHASAIDETRSDFPRVSWGRTVIIRQRQPSEPDPLIQLYFAGNHSDIGGSYPEPESRLSDVALQWMLKEATTIPDPLLIEEELIRPFPDPCGMQHNEPESVREDKLWWVPRWAPKVLRQGWAEMPRLVSGYMIHPSVHQRFACANVDQNGERRPYRPSNLDADNRFIWWYGGSDPNLSTIAALQQQAVHEIDDGTTVSFSIGKASKPLAALLKAKGASSAFGVFPGSPSPSSDSVYCDALALGMLEAELAKQRLDSLPLRRLPAVETGITEHGLLVVGIAEGEARLLARSFGAITMISVVSGGTTELRTIVP